MLEEQQIETTLIGEIADHFTVCGDGQTSRAGLLIDHADQRQGEVVINGYDRESQTRFTATAHVHVTTEPGDPTPVIPGEPEERHEADLGDDDPVEG
ncbi:hypothetical protein QF026_001378 [Streptomyces aurantiacus]|uniref:hypothetical protein n=1 Tax=Streptomyces aurantiacus TaxID=47760 RepID=UPI00279277F2|nr:hypothetical protein [Streptomyces aurantiacus]MDQ0772912.1 hypothetical protein [Streptomyces aurantiacus]